MANRSNASRFHRPSGARRQVSWGLGPEGTVQLSSAGSAVFPFAGASIEDGLTIVRTRGELNMGLSIATTALDGFNRVAFGMCIVSENAAAVGITAIPTPITDEAWDGWYVYWTGSVFSVVATAAISNFAGVSNVRMPIDSKAMRKFKRTDVIVGVIETGTEVGTASLTAKLASRTLAKLA